VDLFISTVYPEAPPTCHIRPAKGTSLCPSHPFMDREGLTVPPVLHTWSHACNINQVIESLVSVFSEVPPVVACEEEEEEKPVSSDQNYYSQGNSNAVAPSLEFPPSTTSPVLEPQINFETCIPSMQDDFVPPSYSSAVTLSPESLLQQRLAEEYSKFSHQTNHTIDNMLRDGDSLRRHSAQMDAYYDALKDDASKLAHGANIFAEKNQGLRDWIEYEREQQRHRGIESMIQCDDLTQQLIQAVAEDAAHEDCLLVLRQELHRNNIEFDVFLKKVRSIARQQFYQRAFCTKFAPSTKTQDRPFSE